MPPLHGSIICLLGVVVASTNAAHLNPSPETIACEATLAPKFEQLAVNLEEHSHEIDGAFEKANSLRAEYLELMDRCVESNDEDDLEAALLQVDQKWGFIKTHVISPIKKHVVDPVKEHVVDPAANWVVNGPPAPPAGNPPKTYTSWKAVQQALALAAVAYQNEKAIDYFLSGCSESIGNVTLKTTIGKINLGTLKKMQTYCKTYNVFEKIEFLSQRGQATDVGTEALIVTTEYGTEELSDLEAEMDDDADVAMAEMLADRFKRRQLRLEGRRRMLGMAEAMAEKIQAGSNEEKFAAPLVDVQGHSTDRWGGWHRHHRHNPHRHNPHRHNPHRHNPHSHTPHSHTPHTHIPHTHSASQNGRVLWVAVRGSEALNDWKQNMKVVTTQWPDGGGGQVHLGFYEQYKQIRDQVFKAVDDHAKKGYANFYITGHSLGGAVAELLAMAVAHRHPTARTQMINFGAPNVGDAAWVKAFDTKIPLSTRIINHKDIVTCLPGHNPVSGIASRVANIFSKGSASNPFKTNIGHFLQFSGNHWRSTRWPSCARSWSVADHNMEKYGDIVVFDHARCQHECYTVAQLKAHGAESTAAPTNTCSADTGGTCHWLDCDSSRNAKCESGKCVCGAGSCAIGGKCVAV